MTPRPNRPSSWCTAPRPAAGVEAHRPVPAGRQPHRLPRHAHGPRRAHALNSPDVDLQTHINDVVNLILFEDLEGRGADRPQLWRHGHHRRDGPHPRAHQARGLPGRCGAGRRPVDLDIFGSAPPLNSDRFKDGFMQVPWVKPDDKPPHSVKHSIKCFNQPVSFKNPAAKALPGHLRGLLCPGQVGRGAPRPTRAGSAPLRVAGPSAPSWRPRGPTGRPRGVATLIEQSIADRNRS